MTLLRLLGIVWLTLGAYTAPLTHAFTAPCDHHTGLVERAADGHEHHARHDHASQAASGHPASDDTAARADCCGGDGACFGFSCSTGGLAALAPESVNALAASLARPGTQRTPPHPPTAGHYLLPLRPPA